MTKAYSYVRFSTPEQAMGDSLRRQTTKAREYAERNGLVLDETLTFQDLGVSAYTGRNASTGQLAAFLSAVQAGVVERGSYLLVEDLDRMSRQAPRKAANVLGDIVDEGITVVTLINETAYTKELLDKDQFAFLLVVLQFIRGHDESAKKAYRLRQAWGEKRNQAAGTVMTARAPAWLELTPERTWVVREERAKVVRRIFDMAAEGHGQHAITEALNGDGVSTFGDSTRAPGKHWHRTYVARLLSNPAVVGRLVPHELQDTESGRKKRVPLAAVEGYFPAIVSDEAFAAVEALSMHTASPARGRHAAKPVQNILGGIARCPSCAGTMTRVSKGGSTKSGKPYLVCAAAKAGAGCTYKAVSLTDVETALVLQRERLIGEIPAPVNDGGDLRDELASLEAALAHDAEDIRNLAAAIARGPSVALRKALDDAEADHESVKRKRDDIQRRIAATQTPMLRHRFKMLNEALSAEPLDVGAANLALRAALSRVVVNYADRVNQLEMHWLHGGVSTLVYGSPFRAAA